MATYVSFEITMTAPTGHLAALYRQVNNSTQKIHVPGSRQDEFVLRVVGTPGFRLAGPVDPPGDELRISGWGVGDPPYEWLRAVSQARPDVDALVCYRCSDLSSGGRTRVRRGEVEAIDEYRGYFHSPADGDPIHHWTFACPDPVVRRAAEAAGLSVRGEEYRWADELTVRSADELMAQIRDLGPGSEHSLQAWTLDERAYIDSVQSSVSAGVVSEFDARLLFDAAVRDLPLSEGEIATLRGLLRRVPVAQLEGVIGPEYPAWEFHCEQLPTDRRGAAGSGLLTDLEIRRHLIYFGATALGAPTPDRPAQPPHDDNSARTRGADFFPTARELSLLVPRVPAGPRRDELEAALRHPRWEGLRFWPKWIIAERERATERARAAASTDADFLAELAGLG